MTTRRFAKTLTASLALAAVAATTIGCAGTGKEPDEISQQVGATMEQDLRSLTDDWNRFWLVDKPSTLSPYHQP